jgi:hypothetical protein
MIADIDGAIAMDKHILRAQVTMNQMFLIAN